MWFNLTFHVQMILIRKDILLARADVSLSAFDLTASRTRQLMVYIYSISNFDMIQDKIISVVLYWVSKNKHQIGRYNGFNYNKCVDPCLIYTCMTSFHIDNISVRSLIHPINTSD